MVEVFGTFAVAGMVLCYALEARGTVWVFGFAGFCALSSAYAFWIETWPIFVVEGDWSGLALKRGFVRASADPREVHPISFGSDAI